MRSIGKTINRVEDKVFLKLKRIALAALAAGGPAFASNNPITGNIVGNGNIPILSGNNVQIPVQIPVDICGNAVGILGFANASCVGGAAALLDDSGN